MMKNMAKQIDPTLGRRLREIREGKGLTLVQLAERTGMIYTAIGRIERGEREPGWATVLKLAKALNVTPDAFLEEEKT